MTVLLCVLLPGTALSACGQKGDDKASDQASTGSVSPPECGNTLPVKEDQCRFPSVNGVLANLRFHEKVRSFTGFRHLQIGSDSTEDSVTYKVDMTQLGPTVG